MLIQRVRARVSLPLTCLIHTSARAMSIPHTVPLPGGIPSTHRPHTESTTTILVPNENIAFLNPVQQYNRDLSVAVIRAWNELRKEEVDEKVRRKCEVKKKREQEGKSTVVNSRKNGEEGGEESEAGPSTGPRRITYQKITILEALSATGLRSIRYAKEIPDVRHVLANDISPSACEAMRQNVALNGVGPTEEPPSAGDSKVPQASQEDAEEAVLNGGETDPLGRRPGCHGTVKVNEGDACVLMFQHRDPRHRVHVVDLDPYGTAAPFIDSAIGAVTDGGLLCVTCTDLAVLAGSQYPEKCFANYGGASVRADYSHEAALRLVLSSIAQTAARYGRYITPMLAFSIDFYVRVFVRVGTNATQVKAANSKIGLTYVCNFCQQPAFQPLGRMVETENPPGRVNIAYKHAAAVPLGPDSKCDQCGTTMSVGGPMWLGPIQDRDFAKRVLKGIDGQQEAYGTWPRMHGMLTIASEELDTPFYVTMNQLCGLFHTSSLPARHAIHALYNAGYNVSRSHASQGSIKTDAPYSFVLDIVRQWIKDHPVRMDRISDGSPVKKLMEKPMSHEVDFTPNEKTKSFDRAEKVVFYQNNPLPNWGPGTRAKSIQTPKNDGKKDKTTKRERTDVEPEDSTAKKVKVEDATGEADEEAMLNQ
ncbi:N2,N2-dimethylguanosine tRNA methyltransferase-domain-containing protein [Naematelia encephala]|uniref:tRNA (guanine(26)-N(2))-dimethyltransferase n=1 Tax=Naematelia encephala TaxID=71784 RepID=A0A1Y2BCN6_9TREE|nr:N2,N2-dimethylguanosine tRNA methyltransferase-domain-containing protein [Naematelia encephala]